MMLSRFSYRATFLYYHHACNATLDCSPLHYIAQQLERKRRTVFGCQSVKYPSFVGMYRVKYMEFVAPAKFCSCIPRRSKSDNFYSIKNVDHEEIFGSSNISGCLVIKSVLI